MDKTFREQTVKFKENLFAWGFKDRGTQFNQITQRTVFDEPEREILTEDLKLNELRFLPQICCYAANDVN